MGYGPPIACPLLCSPPSLQWGSWGPRCHLLFQRRERSWLGWLMTLHAAAAMLGYCVTEQQLPDFIWLLLALWGEDHRNQTLFVTYVDTNQNLFVSLLPLTEFNLLLSPYSRKRKQLIGEQAIFLPLVFLQAHRAACFRLHPLSAGAGAPAAPIARQPWSSRHELYDIRAPFVVWISAA